MILKMLREHEVQSTINQFNQRKEIILINPWIEDNYLCILTKEHGVLNFEFLKLKLNSSLERDLYFLKGYIIVEEKLSLSTPNYYAFKPTDEFKSLIIEFLESLKAEFDSLIIKFVNPLDSQEYFNHIKNEFSKIILPLYGCQNKALEKIIKQEDRIAKLLLNNQTPVGILIVKTIVNNEFSYVGAFNSIEIKTLFVISPTENGGKGFGGMLLKEALDHAIKEYADNLVVTVSEQKVESLAFFVKNGFEIKDTMPDKYIKGVNEFLLIKRLNCV